MKRILLAGGIVAAIASSACAQSVSPPPPGYAGSSTSVDGVSGAATPASPQYGPGQDNPGQGVSGQPPAVTPQMRHDIAAGMAYRLPSDFMPRATHAIASLRAAGIQPPNSTGLSLDQTISQIRGLPGAEATLRQDGFDARTFVLGMTAFGMTLATGDGQAPPPGMPQPNPSNLAMFRDHPQDVQALLQVIGTPPGDPSAPQPGP